MEEEQQIGQRRKVACSKTSWPDKKQPILQEEKHAIAECLVWANAQKLTRNQRKANAAANLKTMPNEQEMESTRTLAEPPFVTTSDEEEQMKNLPGRPGLRRRAAVKKKVCFKAVDPSV